MTAYDSIDGDYQDYVQAAARKATEASGHIARKHDALFRAVEALTKDPNLSQKARTRIRAVLVNHIEEWTQS